MAEARLASLDDRVPAIGHLQLREDVRDVVPDGLLAERQALRDRRDSTRPAR